MGFNARNYYLRTLWTVSCSGWIKPDKYFEINHYWRLVSKQLCGEDIWKGATKLDVDCWNAFGQGQVGMCWLVSIIGSINVSML